ncbi:response regulator transcription factor [Fimbriimonas ginsengisoli]|uniref:Two component transcriptional regulator, winged helix family n=1 Tax=Fimbriimonas ginsengisoli Gsoil 348 TaxID=661478 RepID=A0A068NJM2_FIMGI|nr:response regulator transcription factor [Fimbriimonas ginsengisoli]AIE83813.1 two component transcriptional regulator, winged helix family [Fimbriimonas ginsengisoli Gsoil 348]
MRILLVEDDLELAATLKQVLKSSGVAVDIARDGQTGLEEALANEYSLIILDLMLPNLNGLKVCSAFRQSRGTTPILMITARDSVDDRIRGLEIGADDYLPKPFDVREFLARVRALIRRDRVLKTRRLQVGDLKIDTRQRTATVSDTPILLTRVEYGILETLASQVGRVVFRETLLDLVWQDREPGSNKLDVAVRSLRRKLDSAGCNGLIQTIYGSGYMITDDQEGNAK